jgi:rRNA biogenesis protein RRP5
MTSASFPRGRKPTPVITPATTAVSAGAKANVIKPVVSKKRKQQDEVDEGHAGPNIQQQEDDNLSNADALFGKKGLAKTSGNGKTIQGTQKKKQKTTISTKKQRTTTTEAETSSKAKMAAVVTFKNLKKGVLLLGSIRQVNETELLVSLPNKLNGVVSIEQTSDEMYQQIAQAKANKKTIESLELVPLNELFQVGQFVSCIVLDTSKETKGKKIHLSLRSSLLHSELTPLSITKGMTIYGSISSLEDHGAIVNLGIRGMNAFVPQKEIATMDITSKQGQQMLFTVLSVNTHTLTATLTPERSQVVKNVTRGDFFTLKTLYPGMLLNVRVEEVLSNGLSVNFLTFFHGTVEQNHMSTPCQAGWSEIYKKSMKGRARIISIDRLAKTINLSMAPHIVHLQIPEFTLV